MNIPGVQATLPEDFKNVPAKIIVAVLLQRLKVPQIITQADIDAIAGTAVLEGWTHPNEEAGAVFQIVQKQQWSWVAPK